MTTTTEIVALERAFWQALVDRAPDKAAALLTNEAVNVAMFGIHHFTPSDYQSMAGNGPAQLTSFEFSNERVIFPIEDVAILSYQARLTFTMAGQNHEMVCFDTTTWIRKGGRWLAAAHTETRKQEA